MINIATNTIVATIPVGSPVSIALTSGIKPPQNLSAHQKKNDFGFVFSLINQLRWTATSLPGTPASGYVIFRNGVEIARMSANTFHFNDDDEIKKGKTYVYGIAAVTQMGTLSQIATIIVD